MPTLGQVPERLACQPGGVCVVRGHVFVWHELVHACAREGVMLGRPCREPPQTLGPVLTEPAGQRRRRQWRRGRTTCQAWMRQQQPLPLLASHFLITARAVTASCSSAGWAGPQPCERISVEATPGRRRNPLSSSLSMWSCPTPPLELHLHRQGATVGVRVRGQSHV